MSEEKETELTISKQSYKKPKTRLFNSLIRSMGLSKALSTNPFVADGNILLQQKDYTSAIIAFKSAISEDSTSFDGYIGLARAYRTKGGLANAKLSIKAYYKALEIDYLSLETYEELISLYQRVGDKKRETLERKKLFVARNLKSTPSDPTANNNMGVLLLQQNNFNYAIRFFKKSLKAKPKFMLARKNLAKALLKKSTGEKDKMKRDDFLKKVAQHIHIILSEEKDAADVLLLKSKLLFQKEEFEKALEVCNRAYHLEPGLKEVYNTKRAIEEKLGNISKAGEAYEMYQSIEKAEKEEKQKR